MKKLMLFITLVTMSCTATSQNLTPKVQIQNKDTLFCFSMPQCKLIATYLENSQYCDSVLVQTETQVELLYQLQCVCDSSMLMLNMKADNQQTIIANQQDMIMDLNIKLGQAEKKFKNERWQKRLMAAGFFIISTVAVIK